MLISDAHLRGTRAAQPAASAVPAGTLYYVTDELVMERASGTVVGVAWESYSSTAGVSGVSTSGSPSAGEVAQFTAATVITGVAKSSVGRIAQVVSTLSSAVNTGSTAIPADDTIPQITEGDEYMTLAITPTDAASTLLIQVLCTLANGTGARSMIAALFQDATANALAATMQFTAVANAPIVIPLNHTMIAGTTSATTFRVRGGTNGGGTNTFNGFSAGRIFGAIPKSSIVITEILP